MDDDSGISPVRRSNTARSIGSGLSRRFTNLLTTDRRRATDLTPRAKNELGLSLLYEPPSEVPVVADFIFVHGLGGGSTTTWSLDQDENFFWPKHWLPKDPDFDGIRIHSFGYDANWTTWLHNPLNVHDFGRSLLEDVLNDPGIGGDATPIILIGHSMGGLVIKKACILSKTNPSFAGVGERLHSFYFLGTPHRGSNLAGTLSKLLMLSGVGKRAFVTGLETKSEMIRVLNDDFRMHYAGIHLHTFYESRPTPPVGMIVDIESATLGYTEERAQLMNASHRDLAKFESPQDNNYKSLRNRLAVTVNQIKDRVKEQELELERQREQDIERARQRELELERARQQEEELHRAREQERERAERERRRDQVFPIPETPPLRPRLAMGRQAPSYCNPVEQMDAIGAYLSVDLSPQDLKASIDATRVKGSCAWLTNKPSFQAWQSDPSKRYFWLKGPPACGKSTLASYVIDCLPNEASVSFHYFKAGEMAATNISSCLSSLAYQMAKADSQVRQALYQLHQHGAKIDMRNRRSLWTNVFTNCIFRNKLQKPAYWVIDALDEAADRGPLGDFFTFLSRIGSQVPLKIFITSRPNNVLHDLFSQLTVTTENVQPDDSIRDIQLYVQSWSANLPADDSRERASLVKRIVDMSRGSFLWTVLVVKELREVFTVEEVHDVLREVPREMEELYHRNLVKLESSRSKDLAKHIITWAVCSVQRLTVEEMKDAVKLSLGKSVARDLRTSLQYICGQFLDLDKQGRIHVIHNTARAFLTDPDLQSDLRIDTHKGNNLIAQACIKYMLSDELANLRRRRGSAAGSTPATMRNPMADYACLRFSEHIFRAHSSDDSLFEMLDKFFRTNVLSWIEHVIQLGDLGCLIRTARHLGHYISRRAKYVPSLPAELRSWTIDLPRIVTQFGANLISDPSAIHTLVPPLCPRTSAIYRHFGYAEDGIKLVGASVSGWDDRICSISCHDTYATMVATSDQYFAAGLADGMGMIYRLSTCEEVAIFSHQESISTLEFGPTSKLLVSAGLKYINVWESATGTLLLHIDTDSLTLAAFLNENETELVVASRDKELSRYQVSDGTLLQHLPWTDTFVESRATEFSPVPVAAAFSEEHQVMAVIYRGKPLQLYSLGGERSIGACIRPGTKRHASANHHINGVVFSPLSTCPRVLVSYWDEVLVAFDIKSCRPLAEITTGPLNKLASSVNGKTLAGSDGEGGIKIFDFETLQFIHKVSIQGGDPVTSLAFTSDSLRIAEVRGTQVNVWEPLVLVSQDSESQSSEPSDSIRQFQDDDDGAPLVDEGEAIVCLQCCEESGIAFCGRSNGHVDICNLDDPENTMRNLYKHRGSFTSVVCIDWSPKSRIAASADSSGNFYVQRITTGSRREWSAETVIQDRACHGSVITQIMVHPDGNLVLVSSSKSDSVWSVQTGERIAHLESQPRTAWKWFIRPHHPSELLLFEDKVLRLFNMADLSLVTTLEETVSETPLEETGATVEIEETSEAKDVDAVSIASEGDDLVFVQKFQMRPDPDQSDLALGLSTTKVHLFNLSALNPAAVGTTPIPSPSALFPHSDPSSGSNLLSRMPSGQSIPSPQSATSPPPPVSPPFPGSPYGRTGSFSVASPFSMSGASTQQNRPTIRDVAEVPDVDSIIGTVKRFNSWFLVFISRKGWVCSVELNGGAILDTFQKHFFIPSAWRNGNSTGTLISKVRRNQDIVFVHHAGVIVIKNGLDNGEHVQFLDY